MGIMETRVDMKNMQNGKGCILSGWDLYANNDQHSGGRIWVLWDPLILKVTIRKSTVLAVFLQALFNNGTMMNLAFFMEALMLGREGYFGRT